MPEIEEEVFSETTLQAEIADPVGDVLKRDVGDGKTPKKKKRRKFAIDNAVFCTVMLALPILQFCIFYIGVNFNSILLAFQDIRLDGTSETVTWTLSNFGFDIMFGGLQVHEVLRMGGMSILSWAINIGVNVPLGLMFSFYISKKLPLSKAFRVILYLPSILSAIVMVTIYMQFADNVIPFLFEDLGIETELNLWDGLTGLKETRYAVVIFLNIFIGFGVSVLMYSNSMSGIDPAMIEAAHLDGASGIKEFWYITLPQVYSTLTVFLYTGVATIFTNQINLYAFYGGGAPQDIQTLGYYLFVETKRLNSNEYTRLSAIGIVLTLIAIPLTMGVKKLLEKLGPKEG